MEYGTHINQVSETAGHSNSLETSKEKVWHVFGQLDNAIAPGETKMADGNVAIEIVVS